jgi:DNA-binding NarL/FixJ family response regulator
MRGRLRRGDDRVVVLRVLIVDDNAPFRAAARALLENGGFVVAGLAESGAAAIEQAGAVHPDVVLLDIGLPDMDGFSVCRELRAAHPNAAVVFCSVRDAEHYGDAIARSSAVGFLAKSHLTAAGLLAALGYEERR